jgi:hypothetical protein
VSGFRGCLVPVVSLLAGAVVAAAWAHWRGSP